MRMNNEKTTVWTKRVLFLQMKEVFWVLNNLSWSSFWKSREIRNIKGNSKSLIVETLQDDIRSNSSGYSLSYGIGLGEHEVIRNGNRGMANGLHTKNIGIGYNKGMSEQRTSNAVGSFISERGEFTTNGVSQIGSVIGGGFTLNGSSYEYRDLEDVNKSREIGVNLTFTPGVVEIYRNGLPTGSYQGGTTVGTSLTYGELNNVSRVKTTIDELTTC